jgi:hypothetical protein
MEEEEEFSHIFLRRVTKGEKQFFTSSDDFPWKFLIISSFTIKLFTCLEFKSNLEGNFAILTVEFNGKL